MAAQSWPADWSPANPARPCRAAGASRSHAHDYASRCKCCDNQSACWSAIAGSNLRHLPECRRTWLACWQRRKSWRLAASFHACLTAASLQWDRPDICPMEVRGRSDRLSGCAGTAGAIFRGGRLRRFYQVGRNLSLLHSYVMLLVKGKV